MCQKMLIEYLNIDFQSYLKIMAVIFIWMPTDCKVHIAYCVDLRRHKIICRFINARSHRERERERERERSHVSSAD